MKVLITLQDETCLEVISKFVLEYPFDSDCRFKLVHIVKPVLINSYMAFVPSALTAQISEERWQYGRDLVRAFAVKLEQAFDRTAIEEYVEEGDTRMEIKEQIEQWQPDLVVLGSHTKHGLEALGSVSRGIVSDASCSFLIVPLCPEKEKEKHEKKRKKLHIIV